MRAIVYFKNNEEPITFNNILRRGYEPVSNQHSLVGTGGGEVYIAREDVKLIHLVDDEPIVEDTEENEVDA